MGSSVRDALKGLAHGGATVLVTPELLSFWVRAGLVGRDRALEGSSQTLALVPGLMGVYLRRAFLARVLAKCHRSAQIEFGTLFSKVDAQIDENVYIGPRCHIGLAHLERDVLIAAGVHIPSGPRIHGIADPTSPIRDQEGTRLLVRIGAGSWVGSGAVVMADVGAGCVVGAGAVVTRPVPDLCVAVGVPARVIRRRNEPVNGGNGSGPLPEGLALADRDRDG